MANAELSQEEIVNRGERLYRDKFKADFVALNEGKLLLIEVKSGEYELTDDEHLTEVFERYNSLHPNAALYLVRVGHNTTHSMGSGSFEGPFHDRQR